MGNRRLHELDEEELRGMLMRRKKGQFSRDARGRALWKWEYKADKDNIVKLSITGVLVVP